MSSSEIYSYYSEALGREIYLRDNGYDQETFNEVFRFKYHMPPATLEPETVLDLGCNIGLTMAHYEVMWPDAKVMGIEMDRYNCYMAARNTEKAIVQNVAVSDTPGYKIYKSWGSPEAYTLDDEGDELVFATTLDRIIDYIGPVDFCKMDIEGEETDIILNLESEWHKHVKSLLVEVHNEFPLDIIVAMLKYKGYQVEWHWRHWSSLWATKSL